MGTLRGLQGACFVCKTKEIDYPHIDRHILFLRDRLLGGGSPIHTPHVNLWCVPHCKHMLRHSDSSRETKSVTVDGADFFVTTRECSVDVLLVLASRLLRRRCTIQCTAVSCVVPWGLVVVTPLTGRWSVAGTGCSARWS